MQGQILETHVQVELKLVSKNIFLKIRGVISHFYMIFQEIALDWLCVKILVFDWLREMFDITRNFRRATSKNKCLLTHHGFPKPFDYCKGRYLRLMFKLS